MNTFMIYPDKVRALGNVMNNNSDVKDMSGVYSNIMALVDENNPIALPDEGEYFPPETVEYDNLPFPIFQMRVQEELYSTSLILAVSSNTCYVGDTVTITATLRDNHNELLDGNLTFKCGDDCITNGTNTGNNNNGYAHTTNGVVSFTYSFDSMGEYIISAESLETNRYHSAKASKTVTVTKRQVSIWVDGILDSSPYYDDEIPFTVQFDTFGLGYSIFIDEDLFDTNISTMYGESYTISNLDPGPHTLTVSYPGNNFYESCSETIEFENGKLPEVSITKEGTALIVEVYGVSAPIPNMDITGKLSGGNLPTPMTYILNTDSSGRAVMPINGVTGQITLTVTTSEFDVFMPITVSKSFTV